MLDFLGLPLGCAIKYVLLGCGLAAIQAIILTFYFWTNKDQDDSFEQFGEYVRTVDQDRIERSLDEIAEIISRK